MKTKKSKKQTSFYDPRFKVMHAFGGSLLKKTKNRTARPLSIKNSIHMVLRANYKPVMGGFLKPENKVIVCQEIKKWSGKYGIKIEQMAINSNHIHVLFKLKNRYVYQAFIKALTGAIAIKISKASKIKALTKSFWAARPFTRIVAQGLKSYQIARDYVLLNQLEALGIIPYQKQRLRSIAPDILSKWRVCSS